MLYINKNETEINQNNEKKQKHFKKHAKSMNEV